MARELTVAGPAVETVRRATTTDPVHLPEPQELDAVPLGKVPAVMAALAALQGRLAARLLAPAAEASALTDREPLLTAEQAAARLNLPLTRVYELARRGDLPAVRLGKYVRFRASELADWIDQHCDDSGGGPGRQAPRRR